FTETLWPDFNERALMTALFEFQKRERRYGKTSEQL
ncbi:MAG: undecaprenyl pyrophosphate synthase, partial [Pseudomonadota bacterium]